jgi:hypothetical protein
MGPKQKPKVEARPESELPTGQYFTVEGAIAATSEAALDKAVQMVSAGDRVAFEKLVQQGSVVVLRGGDRFLLARKTHAKINAQHLLN